MPGRDPVLRRLAFTLPRVAVICLDAFPSHCATGCGRYMGHPGRRALRDNFRPDSAAAAGPGAVRLGVWGVAPGRGGIRPGTVLVPGKSFRLSVPVHLGARHTAALPL